MLLDNLESRDRNSRFQEFFEETWKYNLKFWEQIFGFRLNSEKFEIGIGNEYGKNRDCDQDMGLGFGLFCRPLLGIGIFGLKLWIKFIMIFNQLRCFSNYWNLVKKFSFSEKWISSCQSLALIDRKTRLCDPGINVKKLKMTHAQTTQKRNIFRRFVSCFKLIVLIIINYKLIVLIYITVFSEVARTYLGAHHHYNQNMGHQGNQSFQNFRNFRFHFRSSLYR